jgi:hypothetical protein
MRSLDDFTRHLDNNPPKRLVSAHCSCSFSEELNLRYYWSKDESIILVHGVHKFEEHYRWHKISKHYSRFFPSNISPAYLRSQYKKLCTDRSFESYENIATRHQRLIDHIVDTGAVTKRPNELYEELIAMDARNPQTNPTTDLSHTLAGFAYAPQY